MFAAAEKRRILRHIVQREDRARQLFKAISRQVAAHQSGRVCRNDRSSARLEERTEMMRRLLKLRVQEELSRKELSRMLEDLLALSSAD